MSFGKDLGVGRDNTLHSFAGRFPFVCNSGSLALASCEGSRLTEATTIGFGNGFADGESRSGNGTPLFLQSMPDSPFPLSLLNSLPHKARQDSQQVLPDRRVPTSLNIQSVPAERAPVAPEKNENDLRPACGHENRWRARSTFVRRVQRSGARLQVLNNPKGVRAVRHTPWRMDHGIRARYRAT